MRRHAKTKSLAVTGVPLDHLASRRWKVQVQPSSETSVVSARAGMAAPSASICMRPSMQSAMTSKESPSVARSVSSDITLV